ncbi:cytochrome b562 [Amphritea sp.]|uniref:cytochrome b562 n=1 Tax=Amphritea sp. TaxID=1872502 RepID=UPI0025BC37EE|nr:cytochrome b562 [Amphritea sp.]
MSMFTLLKTPLTVLLLGLLLTTPASAGKLKPTMKEIRLHYKEAIETNKPEQFNQHIQLFLVELQTARNFEFSPERKVLSLEGLNKVQSIVSKLPEATEANLATLQTELKQVDQLRESYHKKVKPGVLDLLIDTLKEAMGF